MVNNSFVMCIVVILVCLLYSSVFLYLNEVNYQENCSTANLYCSKRYNNLSTQLAFYLVHMCSSASHQYTYLILIAKINLSPSLTLNRKAVRLRESPLQRRKINWMKEREVQLLRGVNGIQLMVPKSSSFSWQGA